MATSQSLSPPSSITSLSEPKTSSSPLSTTGTSDQSFVTDTNKIFFKAVVVTNSISVAACLFVIMVYFLLRRRNPQAMSRTSLRLSIAMTCSDIIYHSANLAGYGNLPKGFTCAFVGGWLFATTSFLSTFYACAIALNTQLVFVHQRIPNNDKQLVYLIIPPVLAVLITTPTLIAGVYGFDDAFQYCWYTTLNVPRRTVLIRIITTWSLWLSIALVYLVFAVALITYSLFSKKDPLSRVGGPLCLKRLPSQNHSNSIDVGVRFATTLARRDIARRALAVRVLGYISVPVICVFPGVIVDFIARARPDVNIPSVVTLITAITAGLMGTFNATLLSFDPSVVAVVFWSHRKKKERKRPRQNCKVGTPEPLTSIGKPQLMGDIEIAETKDESQGVAVTTVHIQNANDHGLEFHGHSDALDLENSDTSTIGYDMGDLASMYHGL